MIVYRTRISEFRTLLTDVQIRVGSLVLRVEVSDREVAREGDHPDPLGWW